MDMETWTWRHGHGDMDMETEKWRHGHGDMKFLKIKRKTEVHTIFLHPFTFCSPCKRKFIDCPFFDEKRNGSYPFANELNGINEIKGLFHV
jgi:hypothetical protein